jgi:hypothetical protein
MDERIFDPNQRPLAVAEYIEQHHRDFFFLKSDDFTSEREFRAVLMADDNDEYVSVDYRDALVAVVVGERFPDWQFAGAKEICDEADALFRYMHWHQGRPFALDAMSGKRLRDRRRQASRPS